MKISHNDEMRQSHLRHLLFGQKNNCLEEAEESPSPTLDSPNLPRPQNKSGSCTPKAERKHRGKLLIMN